LPRNIPGVPDILSGFLKAIHVTEREFLEALKKDFREISNIHSSAYFKLVKSVVSKAEQVMGYR